MGTIPKDDVRDFDGVDDTKVLVDDRVLLEAVIESFDSSGYSDLCDVLRVVNRVYRIKTTDLVGGDNMIGARVTFADSDGDAHRAIVLEPHVAEMGASKAYDPNRGEMVDPSTYPLGTVQLIYAPFGEDGFFFDRPSDLEVATSVAPATSPDATYAYFAGWEYADKANGLAQDA